jgi:hypothetical protein
MFTSPTTTPMTQTEVPVTTLLPIAPASRPRPHVVASVAIGLIASAAVFGLLISGVAFLAMAVAFEIALPIARQYDVSVSAADVALAARLAEFWWVPGILAVLSFVGAGVVGLQAIRLLGSSPRG